jgi:copper(I)-binding protein
MIRIKEFTFASALTLAAVSSLADARAHEIKIGDLVIHHPWARQSPMGASVAAGFMTITNTGMQDERLVRASSEISTMVQIHTMKMEGDIMKMDELPEGVAIPAGTTVELKPASLHIMFMGLKAPIREGESFAGTLTFEKAGPVTIDYEVMAPTAGMNMD